MDIIFGPVPSRRFGISLGIDLSPNLKQCNFDCLYCELTYAKTIDKQIESISIKDIILELKQSLENHKKIDVITFTANGEPTLYPYLSELIDEVDKIKGDIKTLILTNGGNIYNQEIQKILTKIDIVKVSLDCVSQKCFKKLDRVDNSVDCSKIVDGLIDFRSLHKNQLILEVLFVKTLNDNDKEIELIKNAIKQIKPNRVDIGTIDRPPAYDVKAIDYETLIDIANRFEGLHVTISCKNKKQNQQCYSEDEIIRLLKRRPFTNDDIENLFNKESKNNLNKLILEKKVNIVSNNKVEFYKI